MPRTKHLAITLAGIGEVVLCPKFAELTLKKHCRGCKFLEYYNETVSFVGCAYEDGEPRCSSCGQKIPKK